MKTTPTRSRISNRAKSLNWARKGFMTLTPPLAGPTVEGNRCSWSPGHSEIRSELNRALLAYQCMHQVGRGLHLTDERSDLARFASQDRHPIPVEHAIGGESGDPVSRRDDARQVKRVGSADADQLAASVQPTDRAE